MKKIVPALTVMIMMAVNSTNAQQPDSVKAFINNALTTMQENSAFAQNVNWDNIKMKVYQLSRNAYTYSQAAPGIKYAFNKLNDKHGWLVFGEEEYHNPKFHYDTSRITDNIKMAALKGPGIYSSIVAGKYAYISIPFFGGQTEEQMTRFAQRIQDSLYHIINENTEGIIIDLRLNAGGNIFPMFAGLSNVLGDDDVAIYTDKKGNIIEKTSILHNDVIQNGKVITSLKRNYGDFSRFPVAVIIGPVTGSAGECLAAGFIGRKKTTLIGENTAGYTTTNNGYLLAGQDYGMVLATGYLRDRFGNAYYENVRPEMNVVGGDDFFNHDKDKKILAAVEWLDKQ